MSSGRIHPKYFVRNFTDLDDTPTTIETDKILKVSTDEENFVFEDMPTELDPNPFETKIDYIVGFGMESYPLSGSGSVHDAIHISMGSLEIAEPGDLTNDPLWDPRISGMVANYPLRNLFTKDISGHPANGGWLTHRQYNANYNWVGRNIQTELQNDAIYYKFDGGNTDFLYSYVPDPNERMDYNVSKKLTISLRVKFNALGTDWQCLLADWLYNSSSFVDGNYQIFWYPSNGYTSSSGIRFYIPGSGNTSRIAWYWDYNIQTNTWYHMVFQIDLINLSNTKLFVDGVEAPVTYLDDSYSLRTFITGKAYKRFTVGAMMHYPNNYPLSGLIKDVVVLTRHLTSTELTNLFATSTQERTHLCRPRNYSSNSDIYHMDTSMELLETDLPNLLLDDGTPTTMEQRWYYIYACPGSNNKVEIRVSWHQPLRDRHGVEREDYSYRALYHPFKNARCIGMFKWDAASINSSGGLKFCSFKSQQGKYQLYISHQLTHTTTSYTYADTYALGILPGNVCAMSVRVTYNALIVYPGGLNVKYSYKLQRHRPPDAAYRNTRNDFPTFVPLCNMDPGLIYRQWSSESGVERVYAVVYDFEFKP